MVVHDSSSLTTSMLAHWSIKNRRQPVTFLLFPNIDEGNCQTSQIVFVAIILILVIVVVVIDVVVEQLFCPSCCWLANKSSFIVCLVGPLVLSHFCIFSLYGPRSIAWISNLIFFVHSFTFIQWTIYGCHWSKLVDHRCCQMEEQWRSCRLV